MTRIFRKPAAKSSAADHVVLGAAIGLRREQVMPFVISLRRTGYSGDIVLYVDRSLARQMREASTLYHLTLVPALQWLPFRRRLWQHKRFMRWLWSPFQTMLWSISMTPRLVPADHLLLRSRLSLLMYPPMDTRFIRFQRFLRTTTYTHVLLSDVRDVLFQTDPFTDLPDAGLAVSVETPRYTIATEKHNAMWLRRVYGDGLLAQIGDRRVSCVGVTLGERERIVDYLRQFCGELLALSPSAIGVGGADTAIHNMLLWTGRLGEVQLLEPTASIVATLNAIDPVDIRLDEAGRLLNRDGSQVSVIHQYDRQPQLRESLPRILAA
jgi:hypothetical protein